MVEIPRLAGEGGSLMNLKKSDGGRRRWKGLLYSVTIGILAGACFNLAFGAAFWCTEGLLGGLLSALLVSFFT